MYNDDQDVCSRCFTAIHQLKTDLSLYTKDGDILIKNYPLNVCSYCGNVDISKNDMKKTVNFLKQQKNKNSYKKYI